MAKSTIWQKEVRQKKTKEMANHSINFAEEASKLTAVFSASYQKFEAEIKRLTTENNQAVKRLTMENKELRERIAKMQNVASDSPNPSEGAPEESAGGELAVGQSVILRNFITATQYNGVCGVIVSRCETAGTWCVQPNDLRRSVLNLRAHQIQAVSPPVQHDDVLIQVSANPAASGPNPCEGAPEDFNPIPEPVRRKRGRRGPNRPAEDERRCQALTNSILISEDGDIQPSQCKRPAEPNSSFCWGHIVNQVCGTVEKPDLEAFNSFHDRLLRKFNRKNGIVNTKKSRRTKPAERHSLKANNKKYGEVEAKKPQRSESAVMHSTNSFTVDVSSEDSESDSDSEDFSAERPRHNVASERQRLTAPLGLNLSETLPLT